MLWEKYKTAGRECGMGGKGRQCIAVTRVGQGYLRRSYHFQEIITELRRSDVDD